MTRSTRTRRRIAALAVPAALFFGACGGDDSSDDTDASDDTEASDETSAPDDTDASVDDTDVAGEVPSCDSSDEEVAAPDGVEFSSPTGDYTAVFPSEPETSEQDTTTADGRTLPVTQHIVIDGETSYATAELAVPEGEPYSLEGGRDGSVGAIGGELVCSDDIELDGRDGVEFIASVESGGIAGTYLSRIITDGETVYQVIVAAPGDLTLDDENVAGFFDSFTFTS